MEQGTVVAEHVLTGNHSSIELNRQSAFVTEMDGAFILFSKQIQLKIPEKRLGESPLIPIDIFYSTVKPLLLLEAKVFIISGFIFTHSASRPLNPRWRFASQWLLRDEFDGDPSANIWPSQTP